MFRWKTTLRNGIVINQFEGNTENRFNLEWEKPNIVNRFDLIGEDKHYSVNLVTGEFDINGLLESIIKPKDAKLYFRRRNRITIGKERKEIAYLIGFESKDKKYILIIDFDGTEKLTEGDTK